MLVEMDADAATPEQLQRSLTPSTLVPILRLVRAGRGDGTKSALAAAGVQPKTANTHSRLALGIGTTTSLLVIARTAAKHFEAIDLDADLRATVDRFTPGAR